MGPTAVPCPYFLPTEPLQETGWVRPPRAPLGVLHAGECHAGTSPQPADYDRCNFGYARGGCSRFPAEATVDAVRFAIMSREANVIHMVYVFERENAPVQHGALTYHVREQQLTGAEARPLLEAQARVFVRNAAAPDENT